MKTLPLSHSWLRHGFSTNMSHIRHGRHPTLALPHPKQYECQFPNRVRITDPKNGGCMALSSTDSRLGSGPVPTDHRQHAWRPHAPGTPQQPQTTPGTQLHMSISQRRCLKCSATSYCRKSPTLPGFRNKHKVPIKHPCQKPASRDSSIPFSIGLP